MGTSRRKLFYWRRWHSLDVGCVEYLVRVAEIHGVDASDLLDSFIDAEKKKTALCGPLKIMLRARFQDYGVFLVTCESKVIAQLRLESNIWEDPTRVKNLCSLLIQDSQPRKISKPPSSIIELRKGMKNVHLRVKVTEKSEIMLRHSRYNGNPVNLCVATVTDLSGSIKLPLWNGQIDSVSVGDEIDIRNARVNTFQGLLQIVPSRKIGELIMIKPSKPNHAK